VQILRHTLRLSWGSAWLGRSIGLVIGRRSMLRSWRVHLMRLWMADIRQQQFQAGTCSLREVQSENAASPNARGAEARRVDAAWSRPTVNLMSSRLYEKFARADAASAASENCQICQAAVGSGTQAPVAM